MKEPIVTMAARINGMELDFDQLHKKMIEECGDSWLGDKYMIKIPVISELNSKVRTVAFSLTMKAGFEENQPVMFYDAANGEGEVCIIRKLNRKMVPTLSFSKARIMITKDSQGRNAPPYIQFHAEVEHLRLVTNDVAHLIATWYASVYIGR